MYTMYSVYMYKYGVQWFTKREAIHRIMKVSTDSSFENYDVHACMCIKIVYVYMYSVLFCM